MPVTDRRKPNDPAALKKAIQEKAKAKDGKGIAEVVRLGFGLSGEAGFEKAPTETIPLRLPSRECLIYLISGSFQLDDTPITEVTERETGLIVEEVDIIKLKKGSAIVAVKL